MDVSVQTWDFWYNFVIGFAVKFYAIGWNTIRVAEAMRTLVQGWDFSYKFVIGFAVKFYFIGCNTFISQI